MAYLNQYTPPATPIPKGCHLDTPADQYDHNYVFPVTKLSSDRLEMRPFIPSEHAQLLFEGLQAYPETLRWISVHVPRTLDDVLELVERMFRRNPESMLYAIFSAPKPDARPDEYVFAGMLALICSSPSHLSIEPGWIIILPPFQRTHVLTHAAGLVIHYAMDLPSQGGLGLRRCQWTTTTLNLASQNAAKRLGFQYEGVLRAMWVLPPGKEGVRPGRKGDKFQDGQQRDNWFASIIADDWENGARDHIDKLMARK
ncbi:acyl-CoA N-acyltransferase [Papiliotrema laurentii]|uniref:Acyl-CoA N-acyltransferase n=1 Tax=Papiliotrema laurentii TaxID=5418 RepID=A0AAD9L7R5_PAPLA|nr:acyl-CoA N-acyltransferase [Papiliotrema laurentii]